MRLKIHNGYTEVSRMKNQSSDLFGFITDADYISMSRENSESYGSLIT